MASLTKTPQVKLCQVFASDEIEADISTLETAANFLKQRVDGSITIAPVYSSSISEALLECARQNQSDVIVLGASREGMLEQVVNGNIPANICRNSQHTVILVRAACAAQECD